MGNALNHSTFSGALDIIVVVQPDGTMKCSPFHVCFGKFQLLQCANKCVMIDVNDQPVPLGMKLNSSGRAYFTSFEDLNELSLAVPLPNSTEQTELTKLNRLSRECTWTWDLRAATQQAVSVTTEDFFSSDDESSESSYDDDLEDTNFELSLCKNQLSDSTDKQLTFQQHKVAYDDFSNNPWRWMSDPQLVVKIGDKLYDWNIGLPIIMSALAYRLPLGAKASEPKLKTIMSRSSKYVLTSDELYRMKLRLGPNAIRFTVKGNWKGTKSLEATIFLWTPQTKLIISDIDGTITRSDVLGHILPSMGKDWAQPGVASLYQSLCANGYLIVYLSSRPIGQAWKTKRYLASLTQDGLRMPVGPVILSPDGMYKSLMREMYHKQPQVFKTQALKQIAELFPPESQPFYSGFGNKETDRIAYQNVGIPLRMIYLVNSEGQVIMTSHDLRSYTTSYSELAELTGKFFPRISDPRKSEEVCHDCSEISREI